jgi:hypothetical protein
MVPSLVQIEQRARRYNERLFRLKLRAPFSGSAR